MTYMEAKEEHRRMKKKKKFQRLPFIEKILRDGIIAPFQIESTDPNDTLDMSGVNLSDFFKLSIEPLNNPNRQG